MTLYKATRPDGRDFYTGTIDYGAAARGPRPHHPRAVRHPHAALGVRHGSTVMTSLRESLRYYRVGCAHRDMVIRGLIEAAGGRVVVTRDMSVSALRSELQEVEVPSGTEYTLRARSMSETPDPWETANAAFQSSEAYLRGDYDQRTGRLRSESRCDRCGGANPVWHAPHDLWNAAVRTDGADEWPFLCPSCFATVAEERGVVSDRTVWALVPDDDLRSAGAERLPWVCAYCGGANHDPDATLADLTAHVAVCPEHPLADAYRWIVQHPTLGAIDHACAECVPGGDMVVAGFRCVPHRAALSGRGGEG